MTAKKSTGVSTKPQVAAVVKKEIVSKAEVVVESKKPKEPKDSKDPTESTESNIVGEAIDAPVSTKESQAVSEPTKEEENVVAVTTETPETPEVGKAKRKRKPRSEMGPSTKKSKKIENPLDLRALTPTVFMIKKRITMWHAEGHKIQIPTHIRKTLKGIRGHDSKIDCPDIKNELDVLYQTGLDLESVVWMASAILYYEEQHNLKIRKRDISVITRAVSRPARVTFAQVQVLYDHYLCGLEDKHGYFKNYNRSHVKPKDMIKSSIVRPEADSLTIAIKTKKKVTKFLPYNLFIREQWKARRPEFDALTLKTNIASVMQLLGVEWKADENIRTEYAMKCKGLNEALLPSATTTVENPTPEAVAPIEVM